MNWTKDKPTKDGWYFWRPRKTTRDPCRWLPYYCAAAEDDGEEPEDWFDGIGVGGCCPNGGWWAGPIEEPKE